MDYLSIILVLVSVFLLYTYNKQSLNILKLKKENEETKSKLKSAYLDLRKFIRPPNLIRDYDRDKRYFKVSCLSAYKVLNDSKQYIISDATLKYLGDKIGFKVHSDIKWTIKETEELFKFITENISEDNEIGKKLHKWSQLEFDDKTEIMLGSLDFNYSVENTKEEDFEHFGHITNTKWY